MREIRALNLSSASNVHESAVEAGLVVAAAAAECGTAHVSNIVVALPSRCLH